jgi:hypothetical protein
MCPTSARIIHTDTSANFAADLVAVCSSVADNLAFGLIDRVAVRRAASGTWPALTPTSGISGIEAHNRTVSTSALSQG